jgi:hypothetical protein
LKLHTWNIVKIKGDENYSMRIHQEFDPSAQGLGPGYFSS